ncbi:MAG: saccharopine dehydrogenase family protein [Kiritimatiellae bacterium]|nr:saccharopine dehydrogenase family protein [Kiritimatiellia bacterium]
MARVMLIGAGGVAGVAAAKMAQNPETFGELLIASRTEARCKAIKADVESRYAAGNGKWGTGNGSRTKITTAQIDAMDVPRLVALIREYKPDLVMNIALPYQDLAIMDACLEAGVSYLDTANYEPPDEAHFEYSWQWAYRERFEKAGLTAILGCGFDPGVTQVFSAYAQKHYFDTIETLDILDCNGGDHGYPFATNFNPEINIREVSAKGSYWVADQNPACRMSHVESPQAIDSHGVPVEYKKAFDKGWWVETAPMAIKRVYNFDQVGEKDMYLLHHEELESLGCNLKGIKRIRFFMTFGQSYLTHLKCLENVGMTRIDPVDFKGQKIVPIEFLKALLPDPATLGPRTKGKTNIGCIFHGLKDGKVVDYYVYNVCDHQECYAEVGSQAISYTTGVPAMIGAKMFLEGKWTEKGVHTCEEFDPDPFMAELNVQGLPWTENFNPVKVD